MNESAHRKKTIFLFSMIILFTVFISIKLRGFASAKLEGGEYTVTSQVRQDTFEDVSIDESTDNSGAMFFEVDEELNPVKEVYPETVINESQVLGSGDTDCRSGEFVYSSEKICSREVGEIGEDLTGGERDGRLISRSSEIELKEVDVPPLISGSFPMDSSVRQIYIDEEEKEDHWTLRPAGEMINVEVVEGNLAPGDEQGRELLEFAKESRTQVFGMEYSLGVSGDAEVVQGQNENNFTVDEYHKNTCMGECRNYANPTPQTYLTNSNIIAHSINYPGYYRNLEEKEDVQIINDCSSNTTFLDMEIQGTKAVGCTPSVIEVIVKFFKELFTLEDEEACTPPEEGEEADPEDDCVSTASLVIIMESPWGAKQDCTDVVDGKCVTEYNDLRNGQFDTPSGGSSNKVYALTDCVVYVGWKKEDVKCAWDVDYIAQELEFQSNDNIPGEPYPSKRDYLDFHVREAENRTDEVYKM
jgi:hypothetical protein